MITYSYNYKCTLKNNYFRLSEIRQQCTENQIQTDLSLNHHYRKKIDDVQRCFGFKLIIIYLQFMNEYVYVYNEI